LQQTLSDNDIYSQNTKLLFTQPNTLHMRGNFILSNRFQTATDIF